MNHKDKNKGTRRQKTGALLVIPKNAIYTCLLGKQRGQGMREGYPLRALCGSRAAPVDHSPRLWSWPWPSSINFLAARSWWRMTLSICCVSCRRLR